MCVEFYDNAMKGVCVMCNRLKELIDLCSCICNVSPTLSEIDTQVLLIGNSLVPILPAGYRDISSNCYTAQLEPSAYLR